MRREKQLAKAYEWLSKAKNGLVTLYIPGKGVFDAYPEDVKIFEAMYGKEKVARVVDEGRGEEDSSLRSE